MICHKLSSLNPYICRGKWDAGSRPADSLTSHGLPHSLQYLSLRKPCPSVNPASGSKCCYNSPKSIQFPEVCYSQNAILALTPNQFIICPLTSSSQRSTLCPSSTLDWHLPPTRSQSKGAANAPPASVRSIPQKLPSQSAMQSTQLPLTEVSTLLD